MFKKLSKTENEVFSLILNGYSTKEIAEKMFIAISTVMKHKVHIFEKLKVHSIDELLTNEIYAMTQRIAQSEAHVKILNSILIEKETQMSELTKTIDTIKDDAKRAYDLAEKLRTKTDYKSEDEVNKDLNGIMTIINRINSCIKSIEERE